MKISISALSIAYGLTPEALRYYEEKGLLSPVRAASSGFRSFTLEDVHRLGIIKSMQRQGFSLEEVRHIMTGCTQDELIALMDEKRAQMREQIALSRAIYDRLSAATDLLRDARGQTMQPRLCSGGAAYLLGFDSASKMWETVPKTPLLKALLDALPLTSYSTIAPLARLQGQEAALRSGICAPLEYLTAIRADFSQMAMSAGPRSVRVSFELSPPHRSTALPALAAAQSFMRERSLTPVSDGYTRQYAWFLGADGRKHQFEEWIIPVM
ncbi:MAG: MerR family transcriptional regulator [Clostridia bacterium]|nr:MerR family transcriptional regulator [Clostridia bacterium]